jgi:DNA-directed RNA polymerase specialized sigma24 family protein
MRDHLPDVAIRAVCANYSRLTPWLEAQELRQEAALVALEAARTWKPGGAPLANYQAAAVARRLGRYIAEQRAPLRPFVGANHTLVDVRACAVEDIDRAGGHAPSVEADLDRAAAMAELHRILAKYPAQAAATLLGEHTAGDVAREMGLTRRQVEYPVMMAKRAIRKSALLQQLAEVLNA